MDRHCVLLANNQMTFSCNKILHQAGSIGIIIMVPTDMVNREKF